MECDHEHVQRNNASQRKQCEANEVRNQNPLIEKYARWCTLGEGERKNKMLGAQDRALGFRVHLRVFS